MHRLGATALALSLVAGVGGVATAFAADGHHVYPSGHQVHRAQHRAARAADDVAGIRAELAAANQRMQDTAVRAEQAAEAYNGAQWRLQQARRDARVADRHARIASADATRQRRSYAAGVVSSYEMGPSLSPMSAIQDSSGIGSVIAKLATLQNAQAAMDSTYDSFRASSTLAGVARGQADAARARARAMAGQARDARDAAAATAQQIAARKTHLIHRLADLQHVSVHLATERQDGIEAAAQAAAQRAAEKAAKKAAEKAARKAEEAAQQNDNGPGPTASAPSSPSPSTPEPTNPPTNPPSPPTGSPAPAPGARAAIAFARAQIGDPYVWGATGPDAWDCSGLTMGAWRAGGIPLPHYSVAQYEQSTPIASSSLRPGDLVFWGSSSSPSSIYHVALYVGNGMIVQAPRTGQDVEEVSMYYWITPNFFARP